MARKATDLLDVFRFGDADDEAAAAAAARASAKTHKAAARRAQASSFNGMILTRRQVVLAGSACCLLVALSFVLGLASGNSGDTPAMQRTAGASAAYAIRGALPLVHPATQRAVEPDEIRKVLERDYGVRPANLRIRSEAGQLLIEIGPFTSKDRARTYIRQTGLDMAHLVGADPFLRSEIVPIGP